MKRIILVAMLALGVCLGVWATDLRAPAISHTLAAADTAANTGWFDTTYTPTYNISDWCYLGFYWRMVPATGNTAGASDFDAYSVYFETSHDGFNNWVRYKIDSGAVLADSGRVGFALSCADSVIGTWGRGMLIVGDSTDADIPDSLGKVTAVNFELWLLGRK